MAEKILRTEYSEEMQRSYMNYSMSVITARAIPDANTFQMYYFSEETVVVRIKVRKRN